MKKRYEAPAIQDLGSLKDLTAQKYNKIGGATDAYTAIESVIGVIAVGSLVKYNG